MCYLYPFFFLHMRAPRELQRGKVICPIHTIIKQWSWNVNQGNPFPEFASSHCCRANQTYMQDLTFRYFYLYVIDPLFPLRDARLAKRRFQYRMISTKREGSIRGFKGRGSSETPSFMPLVECVLSCSVMSLEPHGLYHIRLLCPWNFPGKNTGVGCHFLFKETFLNQGSNPCLLRLLHWQVDSLPLSPLCPSPPNTPVTQ